MTATADKVKASEPMEDFMTDVIHSDTLRNGHRRIDEDEDGHRDDAKNCNISPPVLKRSVVLVSTSSKVSKAEKFGIKPPRTNSSSRSSVI